jgi:hypothetical protein
MLSFVKIRPLHGATRHIREIYTLLMSLSCKKVNFGGFNAHQAFYGIYQKSSIFQLSLTD